MFRTVAADVGFYGSGLQAGLVSEEIFEARCTYLASKLHCRNVQDDGGSVLLDSIEVIKIGK